MGNKKNKNGFTLIELLVVIAIIGLLTSIIVVSVKDVREKARDARRRTDIRQLWLAIELFRDEFGDYPVGEDDTGPAGQQIDFSFNGSFISELIANNYLSRPVNDPGGGLGTYFYVFQNSNVNNIAIRNGACGAGPPEARAVLVFLLERGVSSDYTIWYDSFGNPWLNAVCFYL